VTDSKSVAFVLDLIVFGCALLRRIARVLVVAVVAIDQKVEMDPVDSKSSWILAIVKARVDDPKISGSTLVSGKMKSVSYIKMFVIFWSALVAMHRASVSHHASFALSIALSVKNLCSFAVLIMPSHSPVKKTSNPATTSLACWLLLG